MPMDPVQEAPRVVQRNPDGWILFKNIQKGDVTVLLSLFDDVIEISHRLIVVNRNDQANRAGHISTYL